MGSGVATGIAGLARGGAVMATWGISADIMPTDVALMDRTGLLQSTPLNLYNPVMGMQTVLPPAYQQPPGPTAFNPIGFNPPPVWKDSWPGDYRAQVPLPNLGHVPHNVAFDNAYISPQPLLQNGMPGAPGMGAYGPPFGLPMAAYPLDDGYTRHQQTGETGKR